MSWPFLYALKVLVHCVWGSIAVVKKSVVHGYSEMLSLFLPPSLYLVFRVSLKSKCGFISMNFVVFLLSVNSSFS